MCNVLWSKICVPFIFQCQNNASLVFCNYLLPPYTLESKIWTLKLRTIRALLLTISWVNNFDFYKGVLNNSTWNVARWFFFGLFGIAIFKVWEMEILTNLVPLTFCSNIFTFSSNGQKLDSIILTFLHFYSTSQEFVSPSTVWPWAI